jgi:signal transduction histidine kinase
MDEASESPADRRDPLKSQLRLETDPGWVLARSVARDRFDPWPLIASRRWWLAASSPVQEALARLWRHSVAVARAARHLAREAGDADPEHVARAGMLHGLGRWAIAAVAPEWIAEWFTEGDPERRRALERRDLGVEATTLGRTLAERWGCEPLAVDAAWLHPDLNGGLEKCASDPARLALVQQAFALVEKTPWSLFRSGPREVGGADPRLRLLIADVQSRCGAPFIEPDATPHEERLARSNAAMRIELARARTKQQAQERLVSALAESDPSESPEIWADRAALAWCGVPGVATARITWSGPGSSPANEESSRQDHPATRTIRLVERGRPCAEIELWADEEGPLPVDVSEPLAEAWQGWAQLVAERTRLEERLDSVVQAHRDRTARDEPRLQQEKLAALAEFAAGAGHELNNPLAVIVGRAQLLLAREDDPDAQRSLRAIISQALRAHRILRDLMFVARPPALRPRICQPDEIVRSSLRDLKPEAESRGVRLRADGIDSSMKIWADPDGLRHLADVLIRNALESTPKGGTVQFTASEGDQRLRWTVKDNGRGMSASEGQHLFDPFFCGRQAGRGLGLGLPRAARIVAQAGGDLSWHSVVGQGAVFQVDLPLTPPPSPPPVTAPEPPSDRERTESRPSEP